MQIEPLNLSDADSTGEAACVGNRSMVILRQEIIDGGKQRVYLTKKDLIKLFNWAKENKIID